jgi:molecular chaperone GrpE
MEEKDTITEESVNTKETNNQKGKSKKKTTSKKQKTNPLKQENENLKKELETSKEDYLRLGAEFQNLRKRFNREKEEIVLYANEKLFESILPILDDFERSLSTSENNSLENFRDGIELIHKNFVAALEREGVKPIKAVGEEFDHNLHDALMITDKEGAASGTIIEEVSKGYFYKDKVLRHSKVIVAK